MRAIFAAEIPVVSAVTRIGQGAQNDIVLDDDTVSTSHARLEFVSGGWKLTDLESTNGTFVNGARIVAARLASGDRFQVGRVELVAVRDED